VDFRSGPHLPILSPQAGQGRQGGDRRVRRRLESFAQLNLGPNRSLHLVRVGGEIVLLGAAEHQVTPIRRYSASEAHALGLLEPPVVSLASLETIPAEQPKGFIAILRSKTVVK